MYTGNTDFKLYLLFMYSVYPCVYREHLFQAFGEQRTGGLSLCIQGTRTGTIGIELQTRFIPVYTGNTWGGIFSAVLAAVYPCVYREHKMLV